MFKKCIIVIAAAITCSGQLADVLFPTFTKTSRSLLDVLTKNPLVSIPSHATGNVLATAIDALTRIPTEAARQIGVGIPLPIFSSDSNFGDNVNYFLGDYTAGLGNSDANLDIKQLIQKYGYKVQEHHVITEDGFILTVFRIPSEGPPVFLQHGLLGSAADFVIGGPENSLAYLLSEEGYDVWLGNARGNKYSRHHKELEPSQAAFWDFSWHEIGYYDLPAMIDYTLHKTNTTSVKYVGHSQGTTAFFVMASERPEYNGKISLMIALSPVAFMSHVQSPIVRLMAPGTPFIHAILKTIGAYEFLPDNNLMRTVTQKYIADFARNLTTSSNALIAKSALYFVYNHHVSLTRVLFPLIALSDLTTDPVLGLAG